MPPPSSRLNLKNLDNSDVAEASDGVKLRSTGSSDTEMKNSSIPIQRNTQDDKESSNDASNETSDSDKSLVAQFRHSATHKSYGGRKHDVDEHEHDDAHENHSDDEQAADFVEEPSEDATESVALLEKRFYCSTCNQGFTRKHNMVSHELIHLSLKPHVCSQCRSLFRRIHDLKRHEKLHTGEKPFHCGKCNRRFARTDALTRHLNSANACTGKPKEEEEMTVIKPLAETTRLSLSNSVLTTDVSAKTSSTDATEADSIEATLEGPLGRLSSDTAAKEPGAKVRTVMPIGSSGSDSLGGISDTINKANYDVHRKSRAYQHQQNNLKNNISYPYNLTTATTVSTDSGLVGKQEHNRQMAHFNHTMEREVHGRPNYEEGQHYHHHYHHHHHNTEAAVQSLSGNGSWSIPSDREVHHDGQFRKHDEFYPRDIRGSRRESDDQHANQSRNDHLRPNRNGPMRGALPHYPSYDQSYPSDKSQQNRMYSPYPEGNMQRVSQPLYETSPMPNWSMQERTPNVRPPLDPGFVSMQRYADLVNYTNDLQASLTKMDDRIKFLENAEHKRESDDQLQELATQRKRKASDS
ncbi:CIC11C00000003460 [Sungouiella intermedia]|uniref:CIC11C00000003460 n=1 Tax=Sungouiella intermedia TaxID=45354 RepID=A0A1L0C3N4_9ASCO|nr:CIC11C00000003460 [[Candida] intermedia]